MQEQKPQIWTKYGLMPEEELDYSTGWEDTEDYVSFSETYKKKSDGEVVRNSRHVLSKKSLAELGVQQQSL